MTGYEALRAHVLGLAHSNGTSAGLLLLLGQGVAVWIAHRSPAAESPLPTASSPVVDQRHAALVRVLANMALAVGKEART